MLAEALIQNAKPIRKSSANGASSGHAPVAGAMQLLGTAVTHWPVRFTWRGFERAKGARQAFQFAPEVSHRRRVRHGA
jgi:hypothetical protein